MFLTLSNFFDDDIAAVVVDDSCIDVSEFESPEDQSFLLTQGHELLRIDAKAENAKQQIIKAIDTKAEESKGKVIYEIQERFKESSGKNGLIRFFYSLGYWDTTLVKKMDLPKPDNYRGSLANAFRWANGYRAALEMHQKLAGELPAEQIQQIASSIPTNSLADIYTRCSEEHREQAYQALASGAELSCKAADALTKTPEVKLAKAEEKLQEALERQAVADERLADVRANPDLNCTDSEYVNAKGCSAKAKTSVQLYEEQIETLKAQLEAKGSELQKFKFDEELKRQQRIKSLTAGLTVGVPQTTADLSKFMLEAQHYPEDIRTHLTAHIKTLADLCGDYLATV